MVSMLGMGRIGQVGLWLYALATVFVLFVAPHASADELADFEAARTAYTEQRYPDAERLFSALLRSNPPALTEPSLVVESRKYLGASLLFLARPAEATEQFGLLLLGDPTYELDPMLFPAEVLESFAAAKARLPVPVAPITLPPPSLNDATQQAVREVVRQENSRWIAALPFGIGQFQNRDTALGTMFLVSEVALTLASITTFIIWSSLVDERPAPSELNRARSIESGLRIANWATTGGALLLGAAGIVEAQLRFTPVLPPSSPKPD